MHLGNYLPVTSIAEQGFPYRLSLSAPTPNGGWIISFQDHPGVIILDARLSELQRIDIQAQYQQYCSTNVAMSRDSQLLALSGRTDLQIVNRAGDLIRRISHNAWEPFAGSNCFFDINDRLWYVRPGDDPGRDDRLTVVDPISGARIAERIVENQAGYFGLYPAPDNRGVLLDVGCGQDGSYLYRGCLCSSGLVVEEYPFCDRTFSGGFSPDGLEFVTGAQEGDALKVHSFPGGQVVASVAAETLFAEDELLGECKDAVGFQSLFLGCDHILAETAYGRLVLIDREKMRPVGTVWPDGCVLRGYDQSGKETSDPSQLLGYQTGLTSIHSGEGASVLAVYNERVVRLLDFSPLISHSPLGK
jgi:hypothetical protein